LNYEACSLWWASTAYHFFIFPLYRLKHKVR